jgi:hypothetical protein
MHYEKRQGADGKDLCQRLFVRAISTGFEQAVRMAAVGR